MSLKQNKDKTAEERRKEIEWAAEQLGFELEPLFEDDTELVIPKKDHTKE